MLYSYEPSVPVGTFAFTCTSGRFGVVGTTFEDSRKPAVHVDTFSPAVGIAIVIIVFSLRNDCRCF